MAENLLMSPSEYPFSFRQTAGNCQPVIQNVHFIVFTLTTMAPKTSHNSYEMFFGWLKWSREQRSSCTGSQ